MKRAGLKTYSHLAHEKRMPTEYELATSRLLYYPGRGFEVEVPLAEWYRKYQLESPLQCSDWEQFGDPRETTYSSYVALQTAQEAHLDGVLRSIEESDYDAALDPAWLDTLDSVLPQLRYVYHTLQMVAAYVGQMAPSGRLATCFAFQAGDEVRRVQRVAYRMAQLRLKYPEFGQHSREIWQSDVAWQGVRRLAEQLLVTYDWGEAFVALNLCAKPILDGFFLVEFARLASEARDPLLGQMFFSFHEDAQWHARHAGSLAQFAIAAHTGNRQILAVWIERWLPKAQSAIALRAQALGGEATERAQQVHERTLHWLRTNGVLS